jgi:putative DNA primase/helicase
LAKLRTFRAPGHTLGIFAYRFLYIVNNSKVEIIQTYLHDDGRVKEYIPRTYEANKHWFVNMQKGLDLWIKSPWRRSVAGYEWVVNPARADPRKFNTFSGKVPMSHLEQPVQPLNEEESAFIKPVIDHIHKYFCDEKSESSDYLLNWLAFPLQQLGFKTGVAVVVKGMPGTGKGLFFNQLMKAIYGEHHRQVKDIEQLTGNFNSLTAKAMFVNLDEATFGGRIAQMQALKNFITEPRAVLTEKYKDSIEVTSLVNLVITTNENFPVAIGEGDRRYFCLEGSRSVANNQAYWSPLLHLFQEHEDLSKTADLFYRFLMTRDLTGWNVRVFPHTQARTDIMLESRDNVTAFLQHMVMHPDTAFNAEDFISTERLYELYKAFVGSGDAYGRQLSATAFARRMCALMGEESKKRQRVGAEPNPRKGYRFKGRREMEAMMRRNGQWSDDQF